MHAAAIRVELLMREARSLKDKRRILKRLVGDLRRTFSVSVAEVDHQDLWQRATLGIAVVAPQASQLERVVHQVSRWMEDRPDVEVLETTVGHVEAPL